MSVTICAICNVKITSQATLAFHPDPPDQTAPPPFVHLSCAARAREAKAAKAARAERLLECGEEMVAALKELLRTAPAMFHEEGWDSYYDAKDAARAALRKLEAP